jgi:hypothetical protein
MPHLHEVLMDDVVTLCPDGSHASFSADIAQIGTVEALEPQFIGVRASEITVNYEVLDRLTRLTTSASLTIAS